MPSKIFSCLGILISALLIYWILRGIDFKALFSILPKGRFVFLMPAIASFMISNIFRTMLWHHLLKKESIKLKDLFMHLMLGLMSNNILPARLGEFVRTYSAGREFNISRTSVFATIFLERLLDIIWLLLFTSFAFFLHFSSDWPKRLAILTSALLCGVILALFVLATLRDKVIEFILLIVPINLKTRTENGLRYYIDTFFNQGIVSKGIGQLWATTCLSLLSWFLWIIYLKFSLDIFGIHLSWMAYPLLTGVINLGVMLPSAPGYIGPFQFACVKGLGLFGISRETALAFSIVFHASWYIPTTIIGFVAMLQFGFNLKQLRATKEDISYGY